MLQGLNLKPCMSLHSGDFWGLKCGLSVVSLFSGRGLLSGRDFTFRSGMGLFDRKREIILGVILLGGGGGLS